ncbi:four helix bundle protein [Rufibacter roseus]|uniref:Four helix bundle protein n=1 Tax=Rufibacter roseus TaxID=1567108 RepID=A0ABW2DF56_9BACT|nr:four helix bundle protein [Rufibacter roseus]
MAESIIASKSYSFALRMIILYKHLQKEQREFYVLTKQVLRSGTSIGANVEEALGSPSSADFRNKLTIALKEARETSYWLRLLKDSEMISVTSFESVHEECQELIKILKSIILTSKKNEKKGQIPPTQDSEL